MKAAEGSHGAPIDAKIMIENELASARQHGALVAPVFLGSLIVRHPQNGPTFSKAPPKKRPRMTDEEIAIWRAQNKTEEEETKRTAKRERHLRQRINKDPKGALQQELGPFLKEAIKARRASTASSPVEPKPHED
jgi:hypothetical protein